MAIGFLVEVLRKRLRSRSFVVDAILLPSPYAVSFGGFVNLPTSLWLGAGGVAASLIEARTKKNGELPQDMSGTSLFGGGLIAGVGSALKALRPEIKIWGVEPETAAPFARSFAAGAPQEFKEWERSFVDGAGGQSVTQRMWDRMQPVVDGAITVTLDETRQAMRLIADKSRTIAEGAGALSVAAALTGKAGDGPIACVVSGGNIDLGKFAELIAG